MKMRPLQEPWDPTNPASTPWDEAELRAAVTARDEPTARLTRLRLEWPQRYPMVPRDATPPEERMRQDAEDAF